MLDWGWGWYHVGYCTNGNNYTFLSCYESTGCLFKARAAGMQSSQVTTAPITLPGNFPHWTVASCPIVVSCISYVHYFTLCSNSYIHTYERPAFPPSAHKCGDFTAPCILEDFLHHSWCALTPFPARNWNIVCVSPWDVLFFCWFFPLTIFPH